MHIVVALRLVPDISGDVEIAEDGKDIDREWIDLKLNEFDENALEEAVLLKERHGARVTALAIDAEGADRLLQSALARGADEAAKISCDDYAISSRRAVAQVFANAALNLRADLFLTGVQTPEDTFGQLAPFVGAIVDWPCASAASRVVVDEGTLVVTQELSGGASLTLRMQMPAVVGIQTASQPVRYVSGTKLREAASKSIAKFDAGGELRQEISEILSVNLPDGGASATMLEGDVKAVAQSLRGILVEHGLMKG